MKVNINDEQALEMLAERLKFWTDDSDVIELYTKMYDNYIWGGVFEGGDFDVAEIVDNDYVNWCDIICQGDDDFDTLLTRYKADGLGDVSCHSDYSYIEAVDNDENPTMFLVRK